MECGKNFCGKAFAKISSFLPVEKLCEFPKLPVDKKFPVSAAFLSFPHIFSPTAVITTKYNYLYIYISIFTKARF